MPWAGRSKLLKRRTSLVASMPTVPNSIETLVGRYDPAVFDARRRRTRIRLAVGDEDAWDAVVVDGVATIAAPDARPEAVLSAAAGTWREGAAGLRSGLAGYRS